MSDYRDILGDLFDSFAEPDPAKRAQASMKRASDRIKANEKKPKPAPQLRVKRVDGIAYVRASDVAALLDKNLSPRTAKALRDLDKSP